MAFVWYHSYTNFMCVIYRVSHIVLTAVLVSHSMQTILGFVVMILVIAYHIIEADPKLHQSDKK